jgi:DNA-binding winged helix-turn-helix (wHTH) protein
VILAFGDCEIDDELYALRRRGRPVKLEPKVFDVLLYLLRRRARVVTKQELLDALWLGEAVSDSVLPRCIAAARRAVGDSRGRGKVIQTLHRRGYRFAAPVAEATAAPLPEPAEARAPFVGRDRALAALRARAARAGWRAAATKAKARAFWPWVQVLRELVSDAPAPALAADLGSGAPDMVELLPELRRRLPRLPGPTTPARTRRASGCSRAWLPSWPARRRAGRWRSRSTTCTGPTPTRSGSSTS